MTLINSDDNGTFGLKKVTLLSLKFNSSLINVLLVLSVKQVLKREVKKAIAKVSRP